MIRVILGFLAVALIAGCGDATKGRRGDLSGDANLGAIRRLSVKGSILATSPTLGRIGPMWVSGGRLWIGDYSGDPFLHVVDLASRKIIVSWGRKGEGPGDFRSVESFAAGRTGTDRASAVDGTQGRVYEIGLRPDSNPEILSSITLPVSPRPRRPTALGDGYVAWSEVAGAHWLLLDSSGVITSVVNGPLLGDDSIPAWERAKASADLSICAHPDGSRFAVFYLAAGRSELHDSTGAMVKLVSVPHPGTADFVRRKSGRVVFELKGMHYLACAANGEFVLGLYSGKAIVDAEEAGAQDVGETQVVHVFNWDGRLLGQLDLDRPVLSLLLTGDSQTLLGASANASAVFEMNVKEQLAQLRRVPK